MHLVVRRLMSQVNCVSFSRFTMQLCVHPSYICDGTVQCYRYGDDELFCDFQRCPQRCQCNGIVISCNKAIAIDLTAINTYTVKVMHLYNQQITSHSSCIGTRNTLMMLNLRNVVFRKIHMSNFLKNLNHLKHISMTEIFFENTTGIFVGLDGILGMTFTNCTMRTIYPYTFARVFNIKSLNLRGTNIHNIKNYLFCDLFNLSLLNLEANHIKQITRHTFQCLHKVNTLI